MALRPAAFRPLFVATLVSLVSFTALIAGRLAYFGFVFPNTYYAKVSGDRLQSIREGTKYLVDFLTSHPFAEGLAVGWVILAGLSLVNGIKGTRPMQKTRVLCAAFVFGILISYVILGGDHFEYWRFYQPIMPIFALPFVVLVSWLFEVIKTRGERAAFGFGLVVLSGAWIVLNSVHFYQSRFNVRAEYQLSQQGEDFGVYMSSFDPLPVMGVTAAGGIALTYNGEVRDLLGLNWVEMAHANPIKEGFRNHASFDVATFWKHPPEILPLFNRGRCQRDMWVERSGINETGVKQLYGASQFQQSYQPVILEMDDGLCTKAFVANDWLSNIDDDRIKKVSWDDLTILGQRE
jgi:hypothetical protein